WLRSPPTSYYHKAVPSPRAGSPERSEPVRLADELLHDLVGAGADPAQAGITPGALDRELPHVAVAAQDLDRLVGDPDRVLGRQQLGLRDLPDRILALVPALRCLVHERADAGGPRRHVDQS